jgi:maltose/moltooligosaccharide transporter
VIPASAVPAAGVEAPRRPTLSFLQIWNLCFGFFGLQFAFALQNANVSRIFQTLGASVEQIPVLWIAAPLTGLLVQPVVGYLSDRTWTRLGRRRPYFLTGALLAAIALVLLPRAPTLLAAAALLWVLDASINISMEPFRALVGDQLCPAQRPHGYAMQSFFIGLGAVVASLLPYLFTHLGVSNHADAAQGGTAVPDNLRVAFTLGAVVLVAAVGWTVLRTREYAPAELRAFAADAVPLAVAPPPRRSRLRGLFWSIAGALGIASIRFAGGDPQLYLVCAGAFVWGLALLGGQRAHGSGIVATVMRDIETMPPTMRRLVPVQFFSWLALFAMWIYTTPAVTQVHFGAAAVQSAAYDEGADWVGVLFAAYNGFAALAAIFIPIVVRRIGLRLTHLLNLWVGAAALLSFFVIRDPHWLIAAMLGVGFAWASILSLPYALLSDSVPAAKMGIYMGIFNFFIVIPQLIAASVLGVTLKWLFGGAPIFALGVGGASFLLAGLLVLRVPDASARRQSAGG